MNLSKRTITSASWNIVVNITIFIVVIIRQIILARILDFEVFGIYAFTSSIVIFSLAFPNFGMAPALLNKVSGSEDSDQLAAVYFTLKALFIVAWAIVMVGGGVFFLDRDYILAFVVLVIANGLSEIFSQTSRLMLISQVTVRRLVLLRLISVLLSLVVSTILALNGVGIWTLLSNDILLAIVMIVGLSIWNPVWKPKILWVKEKVHYFLDMGRKNLLAEILSNSLDRLDDIWTGIFLGEVQMAFYSKAYNYANLPRRFLADPLMSVIRGNYSELRDDRQGLSRSFFFFVSFLIRTGFFIGGILFIIAPEFIEIVLGERWLPMLSTYQLMLVFTLIDPIKYAIGYIFIVNEKPEVIVRARIIQLGVMLVGLFILGNLYGIIGVAVAVDSMLLVGLVHQLVLVRELVDYSIKDLFLAPILSFISGLGLYYLISNWVKPESIFVIGGMKILLFSLGFLLLFLLQEYKTIRDEYLPLVKRAFRG